MAETEKGKKWVVVHEYTKANGTKVGQHDRSTPETSKGKAPASGRSAAGRAKRA